MPALTTRTAAHTARKPVLAPYPLSPMQQGMLFHSLVSPEAGVDIQQIVITLPENIDGAALKKAWQRVIERHDVLRTRFHWEDAGQPVQEVLQKADLPFEQEDWSALSEDQQREHLDQYLENDRAFGFDLGKAPAMRLKLIRLGETRFKLAWTIHHILLDEHSVPIVLHEAFAIYKAEREQIDLRLQKPSPYVEFIEWLKTRNAKLDEEFWKRELEGFKAPTPPPFITRPEAEGSKEFKRAEQIAKLNPSTASRLRTLATEHQLPESTWVRAAWALLLSRYSGEEDVLFGVAQTSRYFSGTQEECVGLFLNTLPVRIRVNPSAKLLDWLKQLHQQARASAAHEQTPLVKIQGWSQVRKGMPLFETLLSYEQRSLKTSLESRDADWKDREIDWVEQTNFPLTLSVTAEPEMTLEISYNAHLFQDAAMQRVLGHLQTLLTGMAAQLDDPLSALPWMTEAELRQLEQWNHTQKYFGQSVCIHELFRQQVARTPDAIAVVYPASVSTELGLNVDQRLTYNELDRRSNQLAHYLKKLGAGPGKMIGICIDRCAEMMVGILGIMKTGAAYMPIDVFYPPERQAYMLQNSKVSILLTKERLSLTLPNQDARRIYLDSHWPEIAQECQETPPHEATPDSLLYVIYTSGSTGNPKGVMTTHANLFNAYRAWEEVYDLKSVEAHLQMASFSFDVFAGDMVRALCSGGSLVICPHDVLLNPEKLYQLMRSEKIQFAEFVPLVLRNLIQYLEETRQPLDFLKLLVAGSDSWYVKEYRDYRRFLGPNTRLINSYGITETTIDSTYFEGDLEGLASDGLVPIGRPFANNRIYILDALQHPLPVGVAGELYIGGDGVARGYLDRPDLTAEKFLPDPFAGTHARMYRSGDSARFLENGNIELLGRMDSQVKVRGFRIELGEIEGAIGQFPGAQETVVVAQKIGVGENRLVAYVVPASKEAFSIKKLKNYLKDKLPFYMVPSTFVTLETLPMTPNGKIDRRSLPVPEEISQETPEGIVPPRNQLESRLVEMWKEVLGIQHVGVRDNFFELGGHSMLAVRIFARIKKTLSKDLPLTALFQAVTVEQLAKLLEEEPSSWSCIVPIQTKGSKPPLFWLHTLGGGGNGMFRYQNIAEFLPTDQPSYGIRAPTEPFNRMDEMAAHYIEEIRKIQPHGPYFLGGYCYGGNVAYEMAQQLYQKGEEVAFLGLIEALPRYDGNLPIERTPSAVFHFLKNLWVWGLDALCQSPKANWERVVRKLQRLRRALKLHDAAVSEFTLEDFIEMADRGPHYRKHVEAHWEALENYQIKPYPGPIRLFRVRKQALRNFDPCLGWGKLARESIDVRMIPGKHDNLFDEPHVRFLASEIQSCLDRAHR